MDEHERFLRENAQVDAIADACAAIRGRIAAEEAALTRRLADAWELAQEQTSRIGSADSRRRDMPLRCIASQISVEIHVNDRALQTKMYDAWRLVTLFAATVDALEGGRISKAHAHVLLDTGGRLEDVSVRAAFETVVLEWAEAETVGRTRSYARQLAEKLDPRTMQERHATAADEQSITIVDLDNGMSQIIALVPTVYAHAVFDRLTRQAKAIKAVDLTARREARAAEKAGAARATQAAAEAGDAPSEYDSHPASGASGDAVSAVGAELDTDGAVDADAALTGNAHPESTVGADAGADVDGAVEGCAGAVSEAGPFDERTTDQTRADLFLDLLLTGTPAIDPTRNDLPGGLGAIHAEVQITMPITTLTGVTQGGAEVNGKAPIDPDTARCLAGASLVWDRVMFDQVTAVVVTVDRYRPTPRQLRFLHARDRRCRFPGCRRRARGCQVDHNDEHHDGGETSICNLACLCVRHHTMKTETEWTARQLPGGRLEWKSPSGRIYFDDPPRVIFVPSDEPPPF